jgi:hypothetical protein
MMPLSVAPAINFKPRKAEKERKGLLITARPAMMLYHFIVNFSPIPFHSTFQEGGASSEKEQNTLA